MLPEKLAAKKEIISMLLYCLPKFQFKNSSYFGKVFFAGLIKSAG
jgi:hypothetical protein